MRGTVTGEAVDADAVLLDAAGTNEVRDRVNAKYGLIATLFRAARQDRRVFGKRPSRWASRSAFRRSGPPAHRAPAPRRW